MKTQNIDNFLKVDKNSIVELNSTQLMNINGGLWEFTDCFLTPIITKK